jgi:hypothetical protein
VLPIDPSLLAPGLLLAGLAAANAGQVRIVSQANGPYHDIQSAVQAASEHDTILVESGTYAGFTIDDKGINVVADDTASLHVTSLARVRNLGPQKLVVLVGLPVAPTGAAGADALSIEDDLGSVRVESCDLNGFHSASGGRGANVVSARDVAFTQDHITSGAVDMMHTGAVGLSASSSRLAAWDTEIHGGTGGFGCPSGYSGGDGVLLQAAYLFGSRSRAYGGSGGRGDSGGIGCACGADGGGGGSGLRLSSGSRARLAGGRIEGGLGGPPDCGGCGGCGGVAGSPGAAISGAGATTSPLDGRSLAVPNPVREVATFPIVVQGSPGDRVFLYIGDATSFRPLPGYQGVFLVRNSLPAIPLGTIGVGGTLSTTYSFPDLGPGVDSRNAFLQAAVQDVNGAWILTGVSSLVVLDRAF